MELTEKGIYDEFKYAGHWWIPGNKESQVSGTIIFSKNGINLELIGSVDETDMWSELKEENIVHKYPIILGECEKGPVTLINGFRMNKRSGYITTSILRFNKMIIGKHLNSLDDFKVNNIALSYTNLESWLKYHPFEFVYDDDTYGQKVNHEEVFEVYIKTLDATIKSNYIISSDNSLYEKVGYTYKPEIKIETKDNRELSWFEEVAFSLRNFFSILMDSPVFIEEISTSGDPMYSRIQIYHVPFKNYRKEKIDRFNHINLDLPKVQNCIGELLNRWFNTSVHSAHLKYIKNIFSSNSLVLEDIFLNYAKAIESFHRDYTKEVGNYVDQEEYEEIVSKMISSVEGMISNDLKSKLQGTLKYANEFGFQRRVKEVIRMLPEGYRELVLAGQKIGVMADQVRNNRDYYTHFGKKPADLYTVDQLFFMKDRLKAIILYVILEELGLDEDLILDSFIEDPNFIERLQTAEELF